MSMDGVLVSSPKVIGTTVVLTTDEPSVATRVFSLINEATSLGWLMARVLVVFRGSKCQNPYRRKKDCTIKYCCLIVGIVVMKNST